jgi:hypothetical protein
MTTLLRALGACALVLALAACATTGVGQPEVPMLRLSPASLGTEIAIQQRMRVVIRGRTLDLLVALEVDREAVRLAVLDMGQTVARLHWDGRTLEESRAPGWPGAVRGERILSELQFVHWPVDQVRGALPQGWSWRQEGAARILRFGDRAVMRVDDFGGGRSALEHLLQGERVELESAAGSRR